MAISKETGLNDGIQGILGLGPNKNNGPSYVWSLKDSGIISKATLSFSLGHNTGPFKDDSYMLFGGINTDQIHGELYNFNLKTDRWWALDLKEFSYGGYSLKAYSPSDNVIAVIDTGTSLAQVPQSIHTILVKDWENVLGTNHFQCEKSSICLTDISCAVTATKVKSIEFTIDHVSFKVDPLGYLLNGEDFDAQLAGWCVFGIMPIPDKVSAGGYTMFLLGDVFLRNFYSVYDFED